MTSRKPLQPVCDQNQLWLAVTSFDRQPGSHLVVTFIKPSFGTFVWFFMSKSTIFHLSWDGSSWVEPVLKQELMCLAEGHRAVTPVRLEPPTPLSRVKHSTTESLCSPFGTSATWDSVITNNKLIPILPYYISILNGHSKRRPKIDFQDQLSLNVGQKNCRMLQESINLH